MSSKRPAPATEDRFPPRLELSFVEGTKRQMLVYEKVSWELEKQTVGLRYGENPGQPAALYRLVNGNLTLGEISQAMPDQPLASKPDILQPGKLLNQINIADADTALSLLRYLMNEPTCAIVKHNNPCGVAQAPALLQAFTKAYFADREAVPGACLACNRPIDLATAEAIAATEVDVVLAPEYEEGAAKRLAAKKRLCLLRINNIDALAKWVGQTHLDFTSLMDGGLILQWSLVPTALQREDCRPASAMYRGKEFRIRRQPTPEEWNDLLFGWKIAMSVHSASIVYVKRGITVGIGIGGQDRITVAETTRHQALRKLADRLAWERFKIAYSRITDTQMRESIWNDAEELKGGLIGACMVSDGPLGSIESAKVGIDAGISAIIQPGGAENDYEVIRLCNENNVAMVFTDQRCFKH